MTRQRVADLERKIAGRLGELGQAFAPGDVSRFAQLLTELERWNRRMNLTAVGHADEMVSVHLADSLSARLLIEGEVVLDVGTGAGFPGLPLAIALPDREFTLIDSNNKKIQFVRHVTGLLAIDNVTAIQARAEDYAPGYRFDTVIARAVASLRRLLGIAGHHVGEGGVFVALKGRFPAEELQSIPEPWEYQARELHVPGLDAGSRHAVLLRRGA